MMMIALRKRLGLALKCTLTLALAFCMLPSVAWASVGQSQGSEEPITIDPDLSLLPSSDELFAGYVQEVFYGSTSKSVSAYSDSSIYLTSDERSAYSILKSHIEAVARGEETSTSFAVPSATINAIGSAGLDKVIECLRLDHPYAFYWLNPFPGIVTTNDGSNTMVTFMVSSNYQGGNMLETDPAKCGAATAAKSNADAIVNSNKNRSDYNKLYCYAETICGLTDYNDEAAVKKNTYGPADPWQLIWVFDGNPSTTVVCEGYAKAFQYLCDMSTFSGDVACYSVTGTMKVDPDPASGHMWNIVHKNGANYLVDVTNCDQLGSDGRFVFDGGSLFMKDAAGSADTTYTLPFYDDQIEYAYDASLKSLYGTSEGQLVLSENDYQLLKGDMPDSVTISGAHGNQAGGQSTVLAATGSKVSISRAKVASIANQIYNKKAKKPKVVVTFGGKKLRKGADYAVTYKNNKKIGKATVIITGKGNFTGTKKVKFKIVSPAKAKVFWVQSGKVYHMTKKCATLKRSKGIQSGSLAAANAAKHTKCCKVCGC